MAYSGEVRATSSEPYLLGLQKYENLCAGTENIIFKICTTHNLINLLISDGYEILLGGMSTVNKFKTI